MDEFNIFLDHTNESPIREYSFQFTFSNLEDINEQEENKGDLDELRRRRLRTEKHIAMLAKNNPELLDEKAKEIITRIDHTQLKRNNQLQSLDFASKTLFIHFLKV